MSTNNWDEIYMTSPDVTGVRIHGEFGVLCILNVYNDCGNDGSIEVVKEYMRGQRARGRHN